MCGEREREREKGRKERGKGIVHVLNVDTEGFTIASFQ